MRNFERVPYTITQPLTATGAPTQTSTIPYHTIHCATPNMGIKKANEVLERYMCELPMNAIPRDGSVVIDGSGMIHSLLSSHASEIVGREDWSAWYIAVVQQFRRWKCCNQGNPNITVYIDGRRLATKLANASRAVLRGKMGMHAAELDRRVKGYSSTGAVYGSTARRECEHPALSVGELRSLVAKGSSAAVHQRAIDAVPLVLRAARAEGLRVVMSATETDAQAPYDMNTQPARFGGHPGAGAMGIFNDTDYMVQCGGVGHFIQTPGGMHRQVGRYFHKSALTAEPQYEYLKLETPLQKVMAPLLHKHGHFAFRLWSCLTGNDYNEGMLPNFGPKKAADVAASVLEGFELDDGGVYQMTTADGNTRDLSPALSEWSAIQWGETVTGIATTYTSAPARPRSSKRRKAAAPALPVHLDGKVAFIDASKLQPNDLVDAVVACSRGGAAATVVCGCTVEALRPADTTATTPVFVGQAAMMGTHGAVTITCVTPEHQLAALLRKAAPLAVEAMGGQAFEGEVQERLTAACSGMDLPIPHPDHSAVLCVFEMALLMFNCAAVFSMDKNKVVNAMDVDSIGLVAITAEAASVLTGVTAFDGITDEKLKQCNNCELDPRTMEPWDDPGSEYTPGALHGAAPAVDNAHTSATVVPTQVDDTPPVGLRDWSIKRCKAWLNLRVQNGTLPTRVADLQGMVRQQYEMGTHTVMAADLFFLDPRTHARTRTHAHTHTHTHAHITHAGDFHEALNSRRDRGGLNALRSTSHNMVTSF